MFDYILLGIVQGVTEFLPVSSSGHLVLLENFLKLHSDQVALVLVLHLGSIFSVLLFFWQDIRKAITNLKLLSLIFIVTAVTGSIGLVGKDFFEGLFSNPRLVAMALVANGLMLILAQKFTRSSQNKVLGIKDALILGFTQAFAIVPGISRSGVTISTLLLRKVSREDCFKFSFLIFLPVILGATLLEAKKITHALELDLFNLSIGFLVSLVSGVGALFILRLVMRKAKLHYFGYYCMIVGGASFLLMR